MNTDPAPKTPENYQTVTTCMPQTQENIHREITC